MNTDTSKYPLSETSDSSYWLKQVSFEDSQVDKFVPYSSPYILCYHNNKDRPEDVTLYHTQNNQTTCYDSSVSHVERARGTDSILSSSSELVQIPADHTLNSTTDLNNLFQIQSKLRGINISINEYESDKSQIKNLSSNSDHVSINHVSSDKRSNLSSLNSQLNMLRLDNTNYSSNVLSFSRSQQTNDFLTDVSSNNYMTVNETRTQNFQRQSLQLSNSIQTPSLNTLTSSIKINLNNLFDDNQSNKSGIDLSYSGSHNKTDTATSPIKFVSLSPTNSLAPVYKDNISTVNETKHCEDFWEKSVEKIEFSYSEIKSNAKIESDNTILTSYSDVTNITKSTNVVSEDEYDWMKDLDKKTLLSMNKGLVKSYKKSLEKNKRTSLSGSSTSSVISVCSCGHNNGDNKMANDTGIKKLDSPIVKMPVLQSKQSNNITLTKRTPSLKNHFESNDKENIVSQSKRLSIEFANSIQKEQIKELLKVQKQETEKRLSVDFIQKERIKELLRLQKQEHEKKIKTHNRLNQILEKRIEKIESLMNNSHGESILADSVFKPNATLNETTFQFTNESVTSSRQSQAFKNLIEAKENSFPFSKDMARSPNKRCLVEVINLQNTTVHMKPDGVMVVKENQRKTKENNYPLRQTKRLSYSDISRSSIVKNIKSEAWFFPITPKVSRTSFLGNNKNINNSSLKRSSHYTPLISLLTPQKKTKSADISLQAAFLAHKNDLINRSKQRQAIIRERKEKRNLEAEFKRQYEYDLQIRRKLEKEEEMIRARQMRLRQRRRMSVQEIYNQSKKVYDRLPEVEMKQRSKKFEEMKRLNRMRSSIYNKSIQQRVLTKGPNFNLKFKALDCLVT